MLLMDHSRIYSSPTSTVSGWALRTSSFARHLLRQHRPVYENYKAKRLAQLGIQVVQH